MGSLSKLLPRKRAYAKRRGLGLCVDCERPTEDNHARCVVCSAKRVANRKKHKQKIESMSNHRFHLYGAVIDLLNGYVDKKDIPKTLRIYANRFEKDGVCKKKVKQKLKQNPRFCQYVIIIKTVWEVYGVQNVSDILKCYALKFETQLKGVDFDVKS